MFRVPKKIQNFAISQISGRELSEALRARIFDFMVFLYKETGLVCHLHVPNHEEDIPMVNEWIRNMVPYDAADVIKQAVEEVTGLSRFDILDTNKRTAEIVFARLLLYEAMLYVYGASVTQTAILLEVDRKGITLAMNRKMLRKARKDSPFDYTLYELVEGQEVRRRLYLYFRSIGLYYVAPAPEGIVK
jgi:hypothetical protein